MDNNGISSLWDSDDVAAFLKVPAKTVREWRHKGEGPPYGRAGRHVRYQPDDVVAWFRQNIQPEAA